MKYLSLLMFIISFNVMAEDCSAILKNMDKDIADIEKLAINSNKIELDILGKIISSKGEINSYNSGAKGPSAFTGSPSVVKPAHGPSAFSGNDNKASADQSWVEMMYGTVIPNKISLNKTTFDIMKSYSARLKTCKQREKNCDGSVNSTARNSVKPKGTVDIEKALSATATAK